jgi:predicted phosphoribosyltransferase
MHPVFPNRAAAGRLLAEKLASHAGRAGLLVLALPRGGVPVAAEVARTLHAPLDVLVVRKLAAPAHPEFGLGAVASGGWQVLNPHALEAAGATRAMIEEVAVRERHEVDRRERAYRRGRPAPELRGRPVILVDDGIATGSTMRVAVAALHDAWAAPIIVAAPVAARESYLELRDMVHGFVVLALPRDFACVAEYYDDFAQTTDAEVRHLLDLAWQERIAVTSGPVAS